MIFRPQVNKKYRPMAKLVRLISTDTNTAPLKKQEKRL
jgi:hypothetical protein